jgi:hypothetical protein
MSCVSISGIVNFLIAVIIPVNDFLFFFFSISQLICIMEFVIKIS